MNSLLLPQFTDTLNIYPSPVYQVLNVNWSAFLKGIFPTLQSHGWNNGTHGGHHLDSGDLYLLPLAVWLTGVLLATVWESWGIPRGGFCHLSPWPAAHPTHPSIINIDGRKGRQKYLEIQPSQTEKFSYNKNQ